MANRPLICYDDIDIYERDLNMLNSGCWLNDSCINYWFLIQATDDDEIEELASSLQLRKKNWIVAPCTNSESFSQTSSHWSLLLFHNNFDGKGNQCYFCFDSCGLHNKAASLQVAKKISLMFNREFQGDVRHVRCPQQENGFDCGVYILLFTEIICGVLSVASGDESAVSITSISERIFESVSPKKVEEYRGSIKRQLLEDISIQSKT